MGSHLDTTYGKVKDIFCLAQPVDKHHKLVGRDTKQTSTRAGAVHPDNLQLNSQKDYLLGSLYRGSGNSVYGKTHPYLNLEDLVFCIQGSNSYFKKNNSAWKRISPIANYFDSSNENNLLNIGDIQQLLLLPLIVSISSILYFYFSSISSPHHSL